MIIVSSGFGRFQLSTAAAELNKRGKLEAYLTGAYPTKTLVNFLKSLLFVGNKKIQRLIDRGEGLPEERIVTFPASELMSVAGVSLRQKNIPKINIFTNELIRLAIIWYGYSAATAIRRASPETKLYHYRAGFGGLSVSMARRRGIKTLCEHSIVHPALLDYFITHGGLWPEKGLGGEVDRLWRYIQHDIEIADAIVVNSDFVKTSFLHMGWEPDRVRVLYRGVDDKFLKGVPKRGDDSGAGGPVRLLFAGSFERRKGADTLAQSLLSIDDVPWRLNIAGPVDPVARNNVQQFFQDKRVQHLGNLSRRDLAATMAKTDIFIFPTLAEGSARVIFEALACGCYVITTPNGGSIVKDDVHGALVPPGDADALERAIRTAIGNPARVQRIGEKNAELIRSEYTQKEYGRKLMALYDATVSMKDSGQG